MQIFQPLEPEDTSLVEHIVPSKAKRQAFCERFEGVVRTSCIKESWPLIVDTITSPEGFSGICAPLSGNAEEYRYCATGVIYIVFGRLEYDAGAMSALCAAVPEKLSIMCTARTASRFVETDWRNIPQALAVCSEAPEKSKDACYTELSSFAHGGLRRGSPEFDSLCGGMPEPWREACTDGTSGTL